jgi:hypothetical protein
VSNQARENIRTLYAFIFAWFKGRDASEIDGVSGYYSGSIINASSFTRIASENCHDARKERAATGSV